jgi:hypothetical protein
VLSFNLCRLEIGPSGCIFGLLRRKIMKLTLIALALLATTGVVYAACVFC